ncbi:PREDICTED: uncharacterized protein LOC108356977 [Rhagoletis zephyria]|uniref:uncharacterized protein LOC108356977 n=1 Tax=Rhagoletis zephyria TaxID=28612 RepID=UPI0008117673|nr:PREDICTED: uncharacterized protein LOC108356977 [Rhagoletis zephyria]
MKWVDLTIVSLTALGQVIIDSYISLDFGDTFEEAYLDALSVVRQAHINAFPLTSHNQVSNLSASTLTSNDPQVQNNEVPLPEVKIPTFDGDYIEWPTFKEMFVARVHNSGRLNNCQRLHYLKGALAGSAAQDIQHISLIFMMWSHLKAERFS